MTMITQDKYIVEEELRPDSKDSLVVAMPSSPYQTGAGTDDQTMYKNDECDIDTIMEQNNPGRSICYTHRDDRTEEECNLKFGRRDEKNHYHTTMFFKAFILLTTLLTLIRLHLINAENPYNEYTEFNNNQRKINRPNFRILNERHLENNSTNTSLPNNNSNQEKTEMLCKNSQYNSIADLSYTYYLETAQGTDVIETIKKIENAMLLDLADALLLCDIESRRKGRRKDRFLKRKMQTEFSGGDNEKNNFMDHLIDQFSLKIVGLSSRPNDTPSKKSEFFHFICFHWDI